MTHPNTTNKYGVSIVGNRIGIIRFNESMNREEALGLAAYLVVLAEDVLGNQENSDEVCWHDMLEAVRNA